ncbi:LOW QUALITY PROTEIN: transient receptor potential channel-like [Dermacentor silvarum]|nr:LOW QUALITY PROTEIN: transient receptor potential channel-like [Dermacentor silvarum]
MDAHHAEATSPVLRALRRLTSVAYHHAGFRVKTSDAEIPLVPSPPLVRQSSVQRQTSAVDDDASSQRYLLSRGGIRFWKNFAYEVEARPYIRVRHDIDPDQVSGVLVQEWLFSAPRIALVLISHVGPLGDWADARRLEGFRRGLLRAANATPMWLLTNGFNTGLAKLVGDAVSHELRRRQALRCHKHPNRTRATLPPLRLVGIVREDMLVNADLLDGRQADVQIENEGNRPEEGKFELNPDHSNYVLVRDETVNRTGLNHFVLRLEQRLINLSDQAPTAASSGGGEKEGGGAELPLIALLVSGGDGCARLVLEHLKRQLPVVVFEGSGGLADLLAFAYRESQRRSPAVWDPEFVENFLKPELASMLCLLYPAYRDNALARNLLRDRIVECARLSCQSRCLTLVDIRSRSCDLTRLDEILLNAFFKAQRPERILRYNQMKKDLMLTIDWNCPDVAMSQVFLKDPSCKFQVDRDIFEEALVRPGREDFVHIFLERGFRVHKYLTPRRLKQLFKKVQGEQFFRSVCWEGALGRSPFSKLGKHFVDTELNWLIETLTGLHNFVDSQELSMNAAGIYTLDPGAAERKALALLALWCAFTQRTALGKRLWQCCDQPIHLALLVSMTYGRLANLVHEGNTKKDLSDACEEFASMATGVLDCSYQEATCRAYDVLSEENPDWGHRTAVDIAAQANNHKFLAHPCCQRWITNLFMGRISVRDLTWGPLAVPMWLKIILCAFLVFPMYVWVRFKSDPHEMEYKEEPDVEEEKDDREGDEDVLLQDGTRAIDMLPQQQQDSMPGLTSEMKVSFQPEVVTTLLRERELFVPSPPPLWNMVYQMWSAPITKFWTFQIFYIVYLALFSVAVLLPSCGNRYVDMAVCAWTALIALESARRTYCAAQGMQNVPMFLRCTEVLLIAAFVAVYVVARVLGPTPIFSPYSVKVVLCAALLGFYYRQIVIYLPISPTLGPLLYKVRLMVAEDFVNFMRMALLVIISGGIVAHALLYPDYPFNLELLRRTFHRAWFSLFLTPISDLEGDPRCFRLRAAANRSAEECQISDYTDYTCANPGLWPYLFVIQFLVLLKLVLLTLLYALFSHTAQKIESASDDIWKFQRYKLVVDFMNRLCLPPPLNVFSYIIALLQFLWRLLTCHFCRTTHQLDGHAELVKSQLRLSEKDYNYWKHLASQYSQRQSEERDLEEKKKKQLESLSFFLEDMDNQRHTLSLLKGQIQELQRTVGKSFSYLQTLKNATDRPGEMGGALPGAVHVLSRRSPYPSTRVLRYPVPDKYVAWQVLWLEYDPVAYSRPRTDFPAHLQPHVDEDILGLKLASDGGPVPSFAWNSVSTSPAGVSINRQSWIRDTDGQPIIYRLDAQGMPMNPVGRTGLRGRGALPRWGPNHYVLFIITRWQRAKVHLVGGRGLEVVLMRVFRTDHFSLPGDFVPGEGKYETLKLLFKPETVPKCETDDDIKEFFRSSYVEEEGTDEPMVECRQRGYMDDPMNTDHCWREIELWNIHYDGSENLQDKMQNHLLWRLVTEDLFTKLPLGQSVLLHEVTKSLQASII